MELPPPSPTFLGECKILKGNNEIKTEHEVTDKLDYATFELAISFILIFICCEQNIVYVYMCVNCFSIFNF